ncbi:helix-turn-helix domain-containing protein [Clostridium sp. CX1]|uniref:helix-turn-helix domain-containing protein n=1 Tax=Clostridium sp. CX1 TaxID=2978346 RepID=UPI0021C0670A|nr:helix-turn-helix transcriptional regulator [Clostridium sp. CX1]MCT8975535.1 helix-turn-helix domain-containing protein [Clostridium sp. CX1]
MNENSFDDIRDRIRYLREEILKIKQNEMSVKLGLKQGSLSDIERKKTKNVTDRVINDICREFLVNEDWLRYGTKPILIENDSTILDELASEYKLNPRDMKFFQTYLNLTPEQREALTEFSINFANAVAKDETAATNTEETVTTKEYKYSIVAEESGEYLDDSIRAEVEAFTAELLATKKGKISSALEQQDEKLA